MKIGEKFKELKMKKTGALIAYICAGDPTHYETINYVGALVKGGADFIELGLPFSDPIVDGPVIQEGMRRALMSGMNTDLYFDVIKSLDVNIPIIAMTYFNLIFKRGQERFVNDCVSSGVSGIIVPDLPPEESTDLEFICKKNDIDFIYLVGPGTSGERMKNIQANGTGFFYVASRPGVTGRTMESYNKDSIKELIKSLHGILPVAVGFGISSKEQASDLMSSGANGVIVGSAFMEIIASLRDVPERLERFSRELKEGIIDGSRSQNTIPFLTDDIVEQEISHI